MIQSFLKTFVQIWMFYEPTDGKDGVDLNNVSSNILNMIWILWNIESNVILT